MENEAKIDEVLTRGVENVYPNRDFFRTQLLSGKKLTFFLGIDPTGPTLHLGHAIPLLKLAQLQKLGHRIILLIGDFTATIGDPTDKMAARVPLTVEQVLENSKKYKKQASAIINFGGENPAQLKYNSKWLKKMSMADIAKLLSHITYAQTIKRDMFQRRIEEGKDLYLNEFLYPILQGYDSVAMDVDGEVGGNDQTFNMLVGRDLLRKIKGKEKFVVGLKLLADSEGKKMGKTEGNMVSLNETPEEMFGKIMSWPDGMILPAFELCTNVSLSEISELRTTLGSGINPKIAKEKLAEAVVSLYHGSKKAIKAHKAFQATFSEGKIPQDIKEFKTVSGALLSDCLLSAGLVTSKNEWRRLVGEKAVSILGADGELTKVLDFNFKVEVPAVFKIGKHRFLKITL